MGQKAGVQSKEKLLYNTAVPCLGKIMVLFFFHYHCTVYLDASYKIMPNDACLQLFQNILLTINQSSAKTREVPLKCSCRDVGITYILWNNSVTSQLKYILCNIFNECLIILVNTSVLKWIVIL